MRDSDPSLHNVVEPNKIPDQKPLWNEKHKKGNHDLLRGKPSSLAILAEPQFDRHSLILELGCGVGRDALYFSDKGHQVIAADLSEVVIDQNTKHYKSTELKFQVLDMSKKLPFKDGEFNVVFANLSLHYYTNEVTLRIVEEVARVLGGRGLFAFSCKSVNDFHYGNGEEVEENIFVSKSGHVRHLFSEGYAEDLVGDLFVIEHLDEIEEEYSGQSSSIVRCVARKI